jgi:uncharacterized Fe-S cluster-containing radical SAM superfamily protein
MKLSLPFEYDLIGQIKPGNNRTFVAVALNKRHHPFAVYEISTTPPINEEFTCVSGDYFDSRFRALERLIERAKSSISEWGEK